MTIAQVFDIQGASEPEHIDRARGVAFATRQLDGSEGIYLLGDSASGLGIGVALWRDAEAMDAAGAKIAGDIAEGQTIGITISPGPVYDTVIVL